VLRIDRRGAEVRFQEIRRLARVAADAALMARGGPLTTLNSADIGMEALGRIGAWRNRAVPYWDWSAMVQRARQQEPSRFELTVWHGDILSAIALGRASRSDGYVSIDFGRQSDQSAPVERVRGLSGDAAS
jgi:hypothetical protein